MAKSSGKRKPRAVVWDLDGTLADDRARAHFVEVEQGRARDWRSYFDAIDQDPPIAASMEVLRALHAAGLRIVFLTGRPEYTRPKTERWLEANGLTEYDELLMRPPHDLRPSGFFKVDEIERLRRRYELVCAFEDRIDVAEALREAGLPVFLYGAGMEAAAEALEALDASQDELVEEKREKEKEEQEEDEKPDPPKRKRAPKPKSSAPRAAEKKPAAARPKRPSKPKPASKPRSRTKPKPPSEPGG